MVETPRSAYLHIPFCARKCLYCDFPSYAGRGDRIEPYVDALCKEILHAGSVLAPYATISPLDTVYIGGGTPTLAGAEPLERILGTLRKTFALSPSAEVSLEANPGTVSSLDFTLLRACGYNRLSIGLQAWQPHLLATLGRIHTSADFLEAVGNARQAGFDNISADVMLGLPGQTMDDIRETLARVVETGVSHVSFYSLQVEEETPFHDLYASGRLSLLSEDLEREMYHEARRLLAEYGFAPYEISSAAKPGHACRHNLVYWHAEEYFGFGCAAHAYVDGIRRSNPVDLDAYIGSMAGTLPADDPFPASRILETVDKGEQMKEYMMLGFRLDAGVDGESFYRRFGQRAEILFASELEKGIADGLIESAGPFWRLTERGRDMANQVFMAFV